MQIGQEDRVTFQCYFPRSSQPSAIGAVFVTVDGVRRLIPDHWLAQAELSEHGRLLRLIYGCCTIEVAGQHLETLFQDAKVGRLGMILQGPATPGNAHTTRPSVGEQPLGYRSG
jgi:hypothetical protein